MTTPGLRVTPAGLRELAQRCATLAGQVAPTLPAVAASAWQASGSAVSTVNAGGSKVATAIRGRMTASSNKLTTAAREYEAMDNDGAAALAAVPRGGAGFPPLVPRGSGVDGGAGGRGVTPPAPLTVHSGADGGAARVRYGQVSADVVAEPAPRRPGPACWVSSPSPK